MTKELKKSYTKSVLNRKEFKALVLKRVEVMRPGWEFTGVSEKYVDEFEEFIRERLDKSLRKHPSKGKRVRWAQLYS